MKIGLDIHGVIDRFPYEFSVLTRKWVSVMGHEVHIVTGSPWTEAIFKVDGLSYTHHLSIVDYNHEIKTPMEHKSNGWWMPQEAWDRTKGDYAARAGLDIHFEDTLAYAPWFPASCTFVHVGKHFGSVLPILGDFLNACDLLRANPRKV